MAQHSFQFVREAGHSWAKLIIGFLAIAVAIDLDQAIATDAAKGAAIYQHKCAACHGAKGEGVADKYDDRLVGDRSIAELADIITKTMPEDKPDDCVGDEAQQVAKYIYDAFYSPIAQERNKPPRIELARLTVRQYRHTVADLIGSFRFQQEWGNERGLGGEYFKSKRFDIGERAIERLDPVVNFDFGEASPAEGKMEAKQFGARWVGSVLARETGEYEFVVVTQNAAKLWINDNQKPLIDAWVQSGDNREYRGSIWLLGGRAYHLRLEWLKSEREKSASIQLRWKQPNKEEELIPSRSLTRKHFPELLLVSTPFPPDDRTTGYERGRNISQEWEQATTQAALEVSAYVESQIRPLAGISRWAKDNDKDTPRKLREFSYRFVERAFRRPLSAEEKKFFIERQFESSPSNEIAVKRVVLLTLKSPRFLYPQLKAEASPPGYEVASRLSFALWDSLPDKPLLDAAAAGKLSTPDEVRTHARRMLGDLRAKAKLHDFFDAWLHVRPTQQLAKDPKTYPQFDKQLASDLRTSLEMFVEDVLWSEASDFRMLLTADSLPLNARLAKVYEGEVQHEHEFEKVTLKSGPRAGLLSHPYLMADFAHASTTSPIHRGVFLARSVLGRGLRPPPDAVAPLAPDVHPDLTTRERVALQTKAESCQLCHSLINPLGFALENYDALGRYREEEEGQRIDASGSYRSQTGDFVEFRGVRELAQFLADSDEVHRAFTSQLFEYLVKQPVRAYGTSAHAELTDAFARDNFNMQSLVVEIATKAALKDVKKD